MVLVVVVVKIGLQESHERWAIHHGSIYWRSVNLHLWFWLGFRFDLILTLQGFLFGCFSELPGSSDNAHGAESHECESGANSDEDRQVGSTIAVITAEKLIGRGCISCGIGVNVHDDCILVVGSLSFIGAVGCTAGEEGDVKVHSLTCYTDKGMGRGVDNSL